MRHAAPPGPVPAAAPRARDTVQSAARRLPARRLPDPPWWAESSEWPRLLRNWRESARAAGVHSYQLRLQEEASLKIPRISWAQAKRAPEPVRYETDAVKAWIFARAELVPEERAGPWASLTWTERLLGLAVPALAVGAAVVAGL